MAEIWVARQSGPMGFEKVVVIKRLINSLEADADNVALFQAEARLAAQLSHPNIVQTIELGEHENSYFIVMEYLEGENLATVRRRCQELEQTLPDALAARLVAYAAEGLSYAHTRVGLDGRPLNIVHRDVSPQNLFVTYDGSLKVVDFGIAKVATNPTLSGKLRGKLGYMAPEQARSEPTDARADVFGLGVVLFELLAGVRFLGKRNELEILGFLSGAEPIPRVSQHRRDVPAMLDGIVAHALARDPSERFQSARELQAALEEWLRLDARAASSAQVADFMKVLFANRIRKRRAFIEAAMNSDLTPNTAKHLRVLAEGIRPFTQVSKTSFGDLAHWRPVPWMFLSALLVVATVAGWFGRSWLVGQERERPREGVAATSVERVVLLVSSEPSGAQVFVDGTARGSTPLQIDGLRPGEHLLEGLMPGFQPVRRTVQTAPGRTLELQLTMLREETPPASAELSRVIPNAEPERRRSERPRGEAMGRLTLKTEPRTRVYLGKRKLGDTPLLAVPLPAGRQVLRLVNPATNARSSIEVDITPGETLVKQLRL